MKNILVAVLTLSWISVAHAFIFQDPKLSDEESSQIIKLLDTFSNGCSLTRGPAADAISVVQGLASTVRSALNNPNCQSLSGVATSLDSSTAQALGLLPQANDSYVTDLEQQVNSLEKQKQEITLLLTQTTDPDELILLREQLYSTRIQLAGTLSQDHDAAVNEQQTRRAVALRLLLSSTNQAVNQILANESCWVGQPGIIQQVAGAGTILGANAALMTPASQTAVLLTSGMSILSTLVNFFQRLSIAKKVAQFDLALSSTALTCALEKMNDVYCSAQDTLNAVRKVGPKLHDPNEDPVWKGLGLLEKEIPTLLAWLQKLKSGGGANTAEDAEKRANIELKETNLNNAKVIFQGYASDAQLFFDQATNPELRFTVVRRLAQGFFYRVCFSNRGEPDTNNPICSGSFEQIPYFLIGLTSKNFQDLKNQNSSFLFSSLDLSILASIGVDGTQINIQTARNQFAKLFSFAREQLDIEKKLALGQDLTLIFDEALKRNYKVTNPVTAQSGLESLIQFLSNSKRDGQDPQQSLKDQVIVSLNEVLDQIVKVSLHTTTPEEARDVIYEVAELKTGTSFLGDRLERLVRTDLERLVYGSDKMDDVTRLPLLAATDAIAELRRFYQVSSLQEMQESATNAQLIMLRTLDPFVGLFSGPLQRSFDDYDSLAKKVGGEGAAQAIALKTKMCFYFLGSVRPQDFVLKECEGLIARSVLGIETPPFKKELYQQPVQERACLYRNFILKNRIQERRGQMKLFPEFFRILEKLNKKSTSL